MEGKGTQMRGVDHPWGPQMQFAGPKWKANRRQTAIRSRIGGRKQLNSSAGEYCVCEMRWAELLVNRIFSESTLCNLRSVITLLAGRLQRKQCLICWWAWWWWRSPMMTSPTASMDASFICCLHIWFGHYGYGRLVAPAWKFTACSHCCKIVIWNRRLRRRWCVWTARIHEDTAYPLSTRCGPRRSPNVSGRRDCVPPGDDDDNANDDMYCCVCGSRIVSFAHCLGRL